MKLYFNIVCIGLNIEGKILFEILKWKIIIDASCSDEVYIDWHSNKNNQ